MGAQFFDELWKKFGGEETIFELNFFPMILRSTKL